MVVKVLTECILLFVVSALVSLFAALLVAGDWSTGVVSLS